MNNLLTRASIYVVYYLLLFIPLSLFMSTASDSQLVDSLAEQMSIQLDLSSHGNLTICYPKPEENKDLQEISNGFYARLCCPYVYGIGYIRRHLNGQSKFFRECDISPAPTGVNHFIIKPKNSYVLNGIEEGRPWIIRGMMVVMQEVDFPLRGEIPELLFEPMWCSLSGLPSSIQNRHDLDIIFSCMGYILQIQPRNFSMVVSSYIRIQFMYDVRTPLLATLNSIFTDSGVPVNFSYFKFPKAICHVCRIVEHSITPCSNIMHISPSIAPMDTSLNIVGNGHNPNMVVAVVPQEHSTRQPTPPHLIFNQKGKRKDWDNSLRIKQENIQYLPVAAKKQRVYRKGSSSSGWCHLENRDSPQHSGPWITDDFQSKPWFIPSLESISGSEQSTRELFVNSVIITPESSEAVKVSETKDQPKEVED